MDQRLVTRPPTWSTRARWPTPLKLYDAVLTDDPNQPVALADGGWLQAQAGLAGNRSDLVDAGLVRIEKAESIAPDFADAHFFRGFLLLRAKNDAAGAVTELRLYLGVVDPSAPQVPQVQNLAAGSHQSGGVECPRRTQRSYVYGSWGRPDHHLKAVASRWWRSAADQDW